MYPESGRTRRRQRPNLPVRVPLASAACSASASAAPEPDRLEHDATTTTATTDTVARFMLPDDGEIGPHVRHVRGYDGQYSEEAVERARKESLARDRKWLAFCKPVVVKDRYGAERYVYDKPGCEFGRSQ